MSCGQCGHQEKNRQDGAEERVEPVEKYPPLAVGNEHNLGLSTIGRNYSQVFQGLSRGCSQS